MAAKEKDGFIGLNSSLNLFGGDDPDETDKDVPPAEVTSPQDAPETPVTYAPSEVSIASSSNAVLSPPSNNGDDYETDDSFGAFTANPISEEPEPSTSSESTPEATDDDDYVGVDLDFAGPVIAASGDDASNDNAAAPQSLPEQLFAEENEGYATADFGSLVAVAGSLTGNAGNEPPPLAETSHRPLADDDDEFSVLSETPEPEKSSEASAESSKRQSLGALINEALYKPQPLSERFGDQEEQSENLPGQQAPASSQPVSSAYSKTVQKPPKTPTPQPTKTIARPFELSLKDDDDDDDRIDLSFINAKTNAASRPKPNAGVAEAKNVNWKREHEGSQNVDAGVDVPFATKAQSSPPHTRTAHTRQVNPPDLATPPGNASDEYSGNAGTVKLSPADLPGSPATAAINPTRRLEPPSDPGEEDVFAEKTQVLDATNSPAQAFLESLDGKMPWKRFSIAKEKNIIGRSNQSDICIPHTSCSRRHAAIVLKGTQWYALDLGSTNGVFVNEKKGAKHPIKNGDIIQVGDFSFKFLQEIESITPADLQPERESDRTQIQAAMPGVVEEEEDDAPLLTPPASHVALPPTKSLFVKAFRKFNEVRKKAFADPPPVVLKPGQPKPLLSPKGKRLLTIALVVVGALQVVDVFVGGEAPQEQPATQQIGMALPQSAVTTNLQGEARKRFDLYMTAGEERFRLEDYVAAKDAFEKALKLDQANAYVQDLYDRARVGILVQNEIATMQEKYAEELQRKHDVQDLMDKGNALFGQGDFEGAQTIFQKVLELDPANADATQKVQDCVYNLGEGKQAGMLREAERVFKEASAKANEQAAAGDYHKAIETMKSLQNNDYVKANNLWNNLNGEVEKWRQILEDAVKRDYNNALLFWKNGELAKARQLLKDVLQKYPDYAEAKKSYDEYSQYIRKKAQHIFANGKMYEEFVADMDAAKASYNEALQLLDPEDELYGRIKERLIKLE